MLQERRVTRLGSEQSIPVDFRLICATHRDLKKLVERGQFREDLFYRINVVHLRMPPLRERAGGHPLVRPPVPARSRAADWRPEKRLSGGAERR